MLSDSEESHHSKCCFVPQHDNPNGNMQNEKSYWNKWYIAVLLFLIVQIIIFYLITVEFKK